MKKPSILLIAIAAVSFMMISWTTSNSATFDNRADLLEPFGCGINGPDGFHTEADAVNFVYTFSGNGNMRCSFSIVSNSTGRVWVVSGNPCLTPAGITTQVLKTVNASGNAVLQCMVRS